MTIAFSPVSNERDQRSRRRTRTMAPVACVVIVLLAACGKSGGSKDSLPPVEEQLGLEQDGIIARQGKAENIIRDCMKAQGFEYVPVDAVAQRADVVGQTGLSEADFEKQYGYGITTLYEQRKNQTANGPNQLIRKALSDSTRTAYDRALRGDDATATFDQAVDTGDYSRLGGCTKEATEKVFGGVEVFQSLQAKLDELDERIVADSRMVGAVGKWSKCMHDGGQDLADPDEVDSVLKGELETIVGPSGKPNADYDHAALAALQKREVVMVTADIACAKKYIVDVEAKVRTEYERPFREDNAALLSKVPPP